MLKRRNRENTPSINKIISFGRRQKAKLIIMLIAFISAFVSFFFIFDPIIFKIDKPFTILLMGLDSSKERTQNNDGQGKFTDVMILASVNPKNNKVVALNFNRDMYTYIPCSNTYENITHGYTNGGVSCAVQTVENATKTPVELYALVDLDSFVDLVNIIGGVDIKSNQTFCEQNSKGQANAECFKRNKDYKMDGEQALAYVRHRHVDGLDGRMERQIQVIKAALSKISFSNMLIGAPQLIGTALTKVKTNVTAISGLALLNTFKKSSDNIEKLSYKTTSVWWENAYEIADQKSFLQAVNKIRINTDLPETTLKK